MASMMLVAGWVGLFLAAVSADSVTKVYQKVGDDIVLKLDSPLTDKPTRILWSHGEAFAVLWEGKEVECFRHFKGRCSLDFTSGALTLTGLTGEDAGVYTPRINGILAGPTRLVLVSPVATPAVNISCHNDTSCVLTCDGATADAEPLTYTWRLGDKVLTPSTKEQRITKGDDSGASEFSCELENPVSRETSRPVANPFYSAPAGTNLRISTGLTVFICLLVLVLLLVLFHRWKAGAWFFRKESMPWEAGFWRSNEGQANLSRDDGESNGTTARPFKPGTEEETPMT